MGRRCYLSFAVGRFGYTAGRRKLDASAARIGWLLGVGYFLPGLLWIGEAFLVDADRFAWLQTIRSDLLLPMGLALFWAAGLLDWRIAVSRRGPGSKALTLIGALTLAEVARSILLTGFPWGLFAYAWIDAPVAQAAAWIGPYALNGATILAALAPYFLLLAIKRAAPRPAVLSAAALGLGVIGAFWWAGSARLADARLALTDVSIRLVQPNTPQAEKWDPAFVERNLLTLLNLSGGPVERGGVDLVVWPESATPYSIETDETLRGAVMARMPEGARLAYGALRVERPPGGRRLVYNSLFVVGPAAAPRIEAHYDKHHLVPFGEYVPLESILEPMGVLAIAGGRGGFAAGPGPRTISAPGVPPFQPLICYEAVFPDERPPLSERPRWLLQSTNDAWFGESSGPWQHLAQARFRAIEQGLPLYRAANTGVSAGVDPYGRVLAELSVGRRGVLDLPLVEPLAPTLFLRWGHIPLLGFLVAFVASIVVIRAQEVDG